MNIRTGILGEPDGWREILTQEGIPHAVVQGELTPDSYCVLAVNDSVDDREIAMIRQYLRLGGSVLCSAKTFASIRGGTRNGKHIGYVRPAESSAFAGIGLVDIRQDGFVAWSANDLRADDGSATAFVGSLDGGHCIALPVDPSETIKLSDVIRKSFYASSGRLPFERVSAVDKNGIRRIVRRSLEHLHKVRGIPYVHLWHFPGNAPTAFGFRIDTDYGSLGDIELVYEFLRANRVPGTWFVDVKSQKGFLWRFSQMQGQEVGIHCFEHRTFEDEARNHENILKARHLFRDVKIDAGGYAAPFGKWNPALARVVKEFRFEYSSEFGWDYDNFPSTPWIDAKTRSVLQVPVHPISIGSLRRQGYTELQMTDYFDRVVREKLAHREPLFFFHHPKDGHTDVLQTLFRRAEEAGAQMLTMREYAKWWKGRISEGLQIRWKDDVLQVDTSTAPAGYHLRIMMGDGREAIIHTKEKIHLDGIGWEQPPASYPVPGDLERVRAFNPRIPITVALDAMFAFRKQKT